MGKKASALIKIVDCVKRRLLHERDCEDKATCLRHELDRRRDGPVTDPCWTWVQGYISAHQDEMTEWGIQWLEDGAERSKYGGRSYNEVLQDIYEFEMDCKNQKDDCNQPAKGQEPQRGLRIAVATRIAAGKGQSHSASSRHDWQVRLSIPFHRSTPSPPPPPCGPGTPDLFARWQDSCAYVPQMVFLNATPDIRHTRIAVRCSDVRIDFSGQGVVSVAFKAEYTTKLFLDPKWLPHPQGVNVMPSSYKLNTTIVPKARVRLECSDGQTLLAEADGQSLDDDSIRWGHDFSFNLAMPSPGEYTLRSVLMAGWAGRFGVEFNKQAIIDGVFARTLAIDPMNASEGDGSCDIGMFRIVDLRDLSETIRASTPVSGTGTDSDPYSAEPNFVAKSPYTFPFSTPQGFFDIQEQPLRRESMTVVYSWSIVRDCARRRVSKVRIYVSPPQNISDATFFLPYVYFRDYAYIEAGSIPLPQLSKIKINGTALGENVIIDSKNISIENYNEMSIRFTASGTVYTVPSNENKVISIGNCDAYHGKNIEITFSSADGFCEINGQTSKRVNVYVIDSSWKTNFDQRCKAVYLGDYLYVIECGDTSCLRIVSNASCVFLCPFDIECFDYEIGCDVVVTDFDGELVFNLAGSAIYNGDLVLDIYNEAKKDIPCSIQRNCSQEYDRYQILRRATTTSGRYWIKKTPKFGGNGVIATYQMDGDEYASLVGIEEIQ